MGLLNLLRNDPALFFLVSVLLLYSVILHEVAHGWVALRFGDDTARRYGRLTLNPLPHIDPFGLLMLLVVGFGWARPVPVDYAGLRFSRVAMMAVSLAGPLTNILLAVIAMVLLQQPFAAANPLLSTALPILARINIVLAAFNLIPLPPLDGSKVFMGFFPLEIQRRFDGMERAGFVVLALLLFTGVLNPVVTFMQNLVLRLIRGLLG